MDKPYNQFLDFGKFRKSFSKVKVDDDPLNDLKEISDESLTFFRDLLNAESTDQLSRYSEKILAGKGEELFDNALSLINCLYRGLNDETILGDPKDLCRKMNDLRLKRRRRLL